MAETDEVIASFLARWQGVTGPERANYQLFLGELAAALDLPAPEPAEADDAANAYRRRVGPRDRCLRPEVRRRGFRRGPLRRVATAGTVTETGFFDLDGLRVFYFKVGVFCGFFLASDCAALEPGDRIEATGTVRAVQGGRDARRGAGGLRVNSPRGGASAPPPAFRFQQKP